MLAILCPLVHSIKDIMTTPIHGKFRGGDSEGANIPTWRNQIREIRQKWMNVKCFILDDIHTHPRRRPAWKIRGFWMKWQNDGRTRKIYRLCWRTEGTTEFDWDSLVPWKRHVVHPSVRKEVCEAESATSTTTTKLNHSAPNRHVSTLGTNFSSSTISCGDRNFSWVLTSPRKKLLAALGVDRFEACNVTEQFFWSRREGDRGNKSTW